MTGEKKASAERYHRRALMTAADRLLVEHGYDGMNMNMLAKEADYSKATVYVYFRSKDEIVGALAIERLDVLKRELALVLKSDLSAEDKLAELGSALKEFAAEDRTYFDFVCEKACAAYDDDAPEYVQKISALVSEIVDALEQIKPRDELLELWYAFYGRLKTRKMFS